VSTKHQAISRTETSGNAIFIGRWAPKILFSLKEKPYRHGELRRNIGKVSRRMLTRTLRNLESTGLITRRATRSRARAFEYSLTKLGRTIIVPLRGMCRWAKRYAKDVSADVQVPKAPPNV
jgi:DNA-binding HxlR family transcriptional regulator